MIHRHFASVARKKASSSSGWNIAGASYDSKSFSVATQAGNPEGLSFSSDGTKMYIGDHTDDAIYQYALSSAWDVSTASYSSVSLDISSEGADLNGVAFKADGTKVYWIGDLSDTVYQYTLSSAWDLSSASYDLNSYSVNTQDGSPQDLFFKDDGTKMYVIGGGVIGDTDKISQYTLSTPWSVSSASYDSKKLSVGSQEIWPMGLSLKDDGTKAYALGTNVDTVFQYGLSSAFDVSTGSYDSVSFSVNSQESVPKSLFIKPDGTKMYVVGTITDTVYQYSI